MRELENKNGGLSTIEYMMMVIIVISALLWLQIYMQRAFQGHWKTAGDAFGLGRQYEASKVTDCAYAQINSSYGVWYDDTCYQYKVTVNCKPGDTACEDNQRIACVQAYCCEETDCNS